jgi:branched-chain amino acid transport system permease protein
VVGVVVYLVHWWLRVSSWGRQALAVRNDESGAVALGISQYKMKVVGCAIGTGIGAIAGAMYSYSISAISPDAFGVQLSLLFLLMIVIGGAGTRLGPVFGGALLGLIPIYLAQYSPLNVYLYGVLLIFAVRLLPRGIVWRTGAPVGLTGLTGRSRRSARPQTDDVRVPDGANEFPARPSDGECLSVRDVSRSFGKLQALSHVSLTLKSGHTLGIVGPNGSGKTTLLNAISGFYRPDEGEILLAGEPISRLSPNKIAQRGVGRTFQVPRIFTSLTIDEHLALARTHVVRASDVHEELAMEYLGSVGLLGRRSRTEARGLSHGQNRFLEIAMAILRGPEVLLLDEPAAGLSAAEVDQLSELMANIVVSGMSIIVVEHHIEMVRNVANEIAVLHLGEVLWQGPPDQLTESEAVRTAFLGAGAVL